MNLIQRQADDFFDKNLHVAGDYKIFLNELKINLWEYKKTPHKIEFVERLKLKIKLDYDKHMEVCGDINRCQQLKYYENVLFFLQEEFEELEELLEPTEFTNSEKIHLNDSLKTVVDDLNKLKLGQQIIYDDFLIEFEELKDFYFLNKKNWKQMLAGKVIEMVAAGVISEAVSKDILDIIKDNYDKFLYQ